MLLHTCWILRQIQFPFVAHYGTDHTATSSPCVSIRGGFRLLILCALIHGLSLFIMFVEGGFAILGLVFFTLILMGYSYLAMIENKTSSYSNHNNNNSRSSSSSSSSSLRRQPIHAYTIIYASFGFVLLIVWGIWHRGRFPEMTDTLV